MEHVWGEVKVLILSDLQTKAITAMVFLGVLSYRMPVFKIPSKSFRSVFQSFDIPWNSNSIAVQVSFVKRPFMNHVFVSSLLFLMPLSICLYGFLNSEQ